MVRIMMDVSSHIAMDPVDHMTCDQCRVELDVSGVQPFTVIECPKCNAELTVSAMLGGFRLLSLLGQGGMGAVYKAVDTSLDRPGAIKVLLRSVGDDPGFVETFHKEAKAAAALNHPNIVQIYQFGREKGQPYIAMELLSGGRLDKMIAAGNQLEAALVIKIAIDIAMGLKAAGEIGLVHGDVKPENILLDGNGTAKIVDFGLAAYMNREGRREGVWGTPYYIAPEKVRGKPGDQRSDIYSLGGTLFHALTLKPPFEGKTAIDVVKARMRQPAPNVRELRPDVHAEVARVVERMLEADPMRRYPTYVSLLADLRTVAETIGPPRTMTRFKRTSGKIVIPKRGNGQHGSSRITASGSLPHGSGDLSSLTGVGSRPLSGQGKKRFNGRRLAVLLLLLLATAAGYGGWRYRQETEIRRMEQARQRHMEQVAGEARTIFVELDETVHLAHQRLREAYPLLHSANGRRSDVAETLTDLGFEEGLDQVAGNLADLPEQIQSELETGERAVSRMRDRLTMITAKRRDLEDVSQLVEADRLLAGIHELAEEAADDERILDQRLDAVTEIYARFAALEDVVRERAKQLAEAERQHHEEEQRQREQEARREAEAERRGLLAQRVEAEQELWAASREETEGLILRNEFQAALERAREFHQQLETDEVREAAGIWVERLALLPELKDTIVAQLAQANFAWGWLGQRDIVGADDGFVHLSDRKISWNEVPPRQMLRFINHYSESEAMPAPQRARLNFAAAVYCYENHALPLAQTYARRAVRMQGRLKEDVERILPRLESL